MSNGIEHSNEVEDDVPFLNIEKEEFELVEEEPRRIFTFPKKIKQVKVFIAIAQVVSGLFFIVLPIIYFVNPQNNELYLWLLAILALITGMILVGLFPRNLTKAIFSELVIEEDKIRIRNSFNWDEIYWKDIQDILITERLSSDPSLNRSIGASIVKFRTITKGYYYFVDSYPVEDIKELKEALKLTFAKAMKGTGYSVNEKHERPSIRSRFIFYEKVPEF
ncbi:MAG TPA: hypothetical protein VMX55_14240 [candidate division Zixibacteria bacterium]|nr:hypothetical protein [candidate division Zixibacteria bacterium]